jgi:hypothetical protein
VSSIYLCAVWITITSFIGIIVILAWSAAEKPFVWTITARLSVTSLPLCAAILWTIRFFTDSMVRVTNGLRPPEQQVECKVSIFMIMIGLVIHIYVMLIAIIVLILSNYIVWAGVRYRVSHIRCSTARHERGWAPCPRREQGKATLGRFVAVKTR